MELQKLAQVAVNLEQRIWGSLEILLGRAVHTAFEWASVCQLDFFLSSTLGLTPKAFQDGMEKVASWVAAKEGRQLIP